MKERHKQIRDYIVQYTISHGWPPSVREIGEGVGLESTSSVLDSALWPDLVLQMRKRKRYRQGGEAGGAKQSG